jgi:stalled ribosome rescue protein Dom34
MNNQKQFGVWMDGHNAVIVGPSESKEGLFEVVAHTKGEDTPPNSNENAAQNHAKTLQAKFFKEIAAHLQNATRVHISGTGKAQEQFIHWLSETPQFKNVKTDESTSGKMNDEKLIAYFADKLN